jgi:hypothetical protein
VTPAAAALLTYSAQVLILVAVSALAALAVRLSLPAARLHYWRGVIALCLLLPAVPDLPASEPAATVTFGLASGAAAAVGQPAVSWTSPLAGVLPWLVLAGIEARRSWSAAATASLLLAVIVASSPILAPVLAVLLVVILSGRRSARRFAT